MAVTADTSVTYDNLVIKEELQDEYSMISPEECPIQQLAGRESVSSTVFDWPVVELQAPDGRNRVPEGDSDVANDAPTLAYRMSNYTQISDKVAEISHTAQAVDAAARNVQRMSEQITIKMKEMKRDKEVMLLSNLPAIYASEGADRVTAGLPAWLKTNTVAGVGGAEPTLSGTTSGYPDNSAIAGTPTLFLEDDLNNIIEKCWNEGAEPTIIMCNGGNKRRISESFVGNASRYKDTIDRKVVNAIDFYDSDFGELTVVPNRFQPTNDAYYDIWDPNTTAAGGTPAETSYNVFVLDPEYIKISYLDEVQQKPLAETGHSIRSLVWCEYGLQIENEKAHGINRDTNNLRS